MNVTLFFAIGAILVALVLSTMLWIMGRMNDTLRRLDGYLRYMGDAVVEPKLNDIEQIVVQTARHQAYERDDMERHFTNVFKRIHDVFELNDKMTIRVNNTQSMVAKLVKASKEHKAINITTGEGGEDAKTVAKVLAEQLVASGYEYVEEADNS